MCYNCGCGIPTDDMGKGKLSKGGSSLTEEDFQHIANEWGMTIEEVKRYTLEELKKQLGSS